MTTNKKYVFAEIYFKIVDIQNSYRRIIKQLTKKVASTIPKDLKDYDEMQVLDQQIEAAERNFDSFEQVKYIVSLSLLTESSQATDDELMNVISLVDDLDKISQLEVKAKDDVLSSWALGKQEVLHLVRENLLAMLNYKYIRKVELGEMTLQ